MSTLGATVNDATMNIFIFTDSYFHSRLDQKQNIFQPHPPTMPGTPSPPPDLMED